MGLDQQYLEVQWGGDLINDGCGIHLRWLWPLLKMLEPYVPMYEGLCGSMASTQEIWVVSLHSVVEWH